MMKIPSNDFSLKQGQKIKLGKYPTKIDPFYESKNDYQKQLQDNVDGISKQQQLLYASDEKALLIIFQGIDAAGKDGLIRHVMSGINPQGCDVYSFKQPSTEELQHDFLWRTTCRMPQRGKIGIFNRSYYEEVLVVRVHPELLYKEGLSGGIDTNKNFWENRYQSIVDMEKHLVRNNTKILKFFLHLSPEEQQKRLLKRIDDPDKNWKFSLADIQERKFWLEYTQAYEESISATSTEEAPWYIVPADDKNNARLITSQIILDNLKDLKMAYPKVTEERRQELKAIRSELTK